MTDITLSSEGVAIATPNDSEIIAAISIEVWLDTYAVEGISSDFANYVLNTYSPGEIQAQMEQPGTTFILFRDNDLVLGYAKLVLRADPVSDTSGTAEVETLYVRRHHQGQGIGKWLLDKAFDLAAQAGEDRLFVTVFHENHKALAFYEKHGLVVDGTWTFMLNGNPVPNVILRRSC